MHALTQHIRDIPDFPSPGILFRDITPLLRQPDALKHAIAELVGPYQDLGVDHVVAMEARGFIFGSLAAHALHTGFVPLRKPGKLPYHTQGVDYALEYGQARLEMHRDALTAGDRVLIVDDVLATGGTAEAACQLVHATGAKLLGCAFLIELSGLQGRQRLAPVGVSSVIRYD